MCSIWAVCGNKLKIWTNKIDANLQLEILETMRRTLRRTARWYVRHGGKAGEIEQAINQYKPAFDVIANDLDKFLVPEEVKQVEDQVSAYTDAKVPKDIAIKVARLSNMFSAFDLAQVAEQEKRPVELVSRLYYQLGHKFELHWFLDQINAQSVTNHWQALARASYREELDWQQRSLVCVLLNAHPKDKNADNILQTWCEDNEYEL